MNKSLKIFVVAILIIAANSTKAQEFKLSILGQQNLVSGDFGKSESNNAYAEYLDYGISDGLELNYYTKKNWGFGIRLIDQIYLRDRDKFESDFQNGLGLSNNEFDISQPASYFSIGTDIGISYLIEINKNWQVEPYFFFGGRSLARSNINAIYAVNGNTTQYQSKLPVFYGYNINPGAKIHWNNTRFGLFLSLEYQNTKFNQDDETTITSSANLLEINTNKRSYDINSFNLGLGLTYRFGKNLNE